MQIISSYGVELRKQNIPIRQTLEIYRSAVSYLIGIYVQVWEGLAEIPDAKRCFNAAEHLVLSLIHISAFGGVTESLKALGIPVGCCADGPSGIRMDCGTNCLLYTSDFRTMGWYCTNFLPDLWHQFKFC